MKDAYLVVFLDKETRRQLKQRCPACEGSMYILNRAGSPVYYCQNCVTTYPLGYEVKVRPPKGSVLP